MEYILVPTDFSKNAFNALVYGIEVSKIYRTKILILHTYQRPASNSSTMMKIDKKMKNIAEDDIITLQRTLREKNLINNIDIEYECINTSIISGIKEQLKSKDIGLIVMGTTGASGLKEFFIGSNAFDTIKNASCPVLAIPSNASFKKIKNIVFATDFDMNCNDHSLPFIFRLSRYLGAKLTMVNIQTITTDFKKTRNNADKFFENCKEELKNIDYEHHYILEDDISFGINKAYKNNKADLLVMVKKSHSLIEYIFKKSITKSLVSEAKLPLLTLTK